MRPPSKLSSVILYSVISAAFIGPGTITTAITAGATHQLQLLWAVALGTLGCLVLQETSARVVISSGLNLGQASQKCFGNTWGKALMVLVGVTVMLGCAAYEAGNILGAVSGLNLLSAVNTKALTILIVVCAFVVLWTNKRQVISWLMTILVGLMGFAFFVLALQQPFSVVDVLKYAVAPTFPSGSALLILGLVGTTIVPYNIFLGSGISKGKTIPLMRIGLTVSVLMGGMITAAILIAGASVQAFSSFPELAESLREKLGPIGSLALGVGLFAAGLSSSITAPYASAIIASTIFGWEDQRRLRWVWGIVLLVGFSFGISGVKPIPVILTVQALNGLILPLLVALLVFLINSKVLIAENYRQGWMANIVLLFIFGSVMLIGLNQVEKTLIAAGWFETTHIGVLAVLSIVLIALVGFWAISRRDQA
ncbi:MAG: divalent metal cation transporter [Cyclobacteriaceae bacterium]|nr:divalent metal cation transporter [Cyclobacteriaceae bacterium]UYN87312.1 MAG: divalent metal cation transporter [Cyclobacteriaceae bacterium]